MLRVNKSRASKGRSPYARTRSGVAIATSATQSQAGPTPMQPEAPVVVPIPIRTLSATSLSSVAGIASTAGPSSFTAQQTNPEAIPVSVASVIETVASQQSTTPSAATVVAVSSTSTWGSTVSLSSSYTILGDYQSTVNSLLDASLSVNTSKVYKQGLQAFYRFRSETSFEQVWPPPIDHIINFIAYMSENGCSFSTVKSYLAGISFSINVHGWFNPIDSFLVRKLLAGYKKSKVVADTRRPITLQLLQSILLILPNVTYSSYEAELFKSAFVLAFFALLRVSEVVALEENCIQMLESEIFVHIKSSKTDQLGLGMSVRINKDQDSAILFSTLQGFQKMRQKTQGSQFLVHFNSKPITQYQFSAMLNKCLNFLNIQTASFKSHSFRIGGATQLYIRGLSETQIKERGRWNSSAYKSYIRPIV
ncbi:uncharacterized protein LOC134270246 isoform X2 [Saccostrea cucullata]